MFFLKISNSLWFSALSFLIGGGTLAVICIVGVIESINNEFVKILLFISLLLIPCIFFFEERGMNIDIQMAHHEIASNLLEFDYRCNAEIEELDLLISYGIEKCRIQGMKDMQKAIFNAQKSLYLNPTIGFLDNVISNSETFEDKCAFAYREINRLCPNQFDTIHIKYLNILTTSM